MWIFGPLPCSTISPVTVTPASACASVVTVSPSTSRMAGRVTVSPASPLRRLMVNVSPTPTLCCVPPALTTAYTTDSSIGLCLSSTVSCAHPGARPSAGRVACRLNTPCGGLSLRSNPTSVPEPESSGRTAPGRVLLFRSGGRARRPRRRPATPRTGHRGRFLGDRLGDRLRRDHDGRLRLGLVGRLLHGDGDPVGEVTRGA